MTLSLITGLSHAIAVGEQTPACMMPSDLHVLDMAQMLTCAYVHTLSHTHPTQLRRTVSNAVSLTCCFLSLLWVWMMKGMCCKQAGTSEAGRLPWRAWGGHCVDRNECHTVETWCHLQVWCLTLTLTSWVTLDHFSSLHLSSSASKSG